MKNHYHHRFLLKCVTMITLLVCIGVTEGFAQKRKKGNKKQADSHASCCAAKTDATAETLQMGEITVENLALTNQNGQTVKLHELMADKTVVMNFLFTTCSTICPPMGANFAELNRRLAADRGDDLAMISISIDPATDTPERLKAWSDKFNGGPGWTLLTGEKSVVEQLLKDLKVFTALKEDHAPIILIGKEGEDDWIRTNGLAQVDLLESTIRNYLPGSETGVLEYTPNGNGTVSASLNDRQQKDESYFTNTQLVNQHGEKVNLYSDLMKDKVVFINPFFAECTGSCPMMHKMMQEVQVWLGDRLGEEVVLLSFTVDPVNDTPEKLGPYAESYGAEPGWHFLSGDEENMEAVLRKIGKYVDDRTAHDNIILIGNMNTGLWKKANGLANPLEVIRVLESVMNDQG